MRVVASLQFWFLIPGDVKPYISDVMLLSTNWETNQCCVQNQSNAIQYKISCNRRTWCCYDHWLISCEWCKDVNISYVYHKHTYTLQISPDISAVPNNKLPMIGFHFFVYQDSVLMLIILKIKYEFYDSTQ